MRLALWLSLGVLWGSTTTVGAQDLRTERNLIDSALADDGRLYQPKVGGRFWIEAIAGPSKIDLNKFKNFAPSIDIGVPIPLIQLNGPMYGVAAGARFNFFTLGVRFENIDYNSGSIKSLGLDFGFLIRTPYVHPYLRMTLAYAWAADSGLASSIVGDIFPGFENTFSIDTIRGGAATIGVGIRVPVIRYLSIGMGLDVAMVGLRFRGEWDRFFFADACAPPNQDLCNLDSGTGGLSLTGVFALTFHY